MNTGSKSEVAALGATLFDETAKAASEAWHRCYAGKTEITRKALSPLKAIYGKLMGLTFVEPRVAPVAALLETAFKSIPKRGAITGGILIMLQGLVALLQNPHVLLEHGQKILDGRAQAQDVLATLVMEPGLPAIADLPPGDDEPQFDDTALPVIASHGLW